MKPSLLPLLASILITSTALAQLPALDVNPNGPAVVRYNDPTAMGKKAPDVSYNDIDGRYLWKESWNPALIIMKAGNALKLNSVRINLYSNDVHYLTKEGELAAQPGKVRKITLYSNSPSDTTTVVGTFEILRNLSNSADAFYEVMNDGKIQLLKRNTITLKKDAFDPATAKDKYHFDSNVDYFIRTEFGLKQLKALNKSSVFDAIPSASSEEAWLSSNKNKLKNPDDVKEFLVYLSAQSK